MLSRRHMTFEQATQMANANDSPGSQHCHNRAVRGQLMLQVNVPERQRLQPGKHLHTCVFMTKGPC